MNEALYFASAEEMLGQGRSIQPQVLSVVVMAEM